MSELQKDFLFVLIKSLSTSEKRQFKLYVNRLGINVDAKFLLLFSELDKMKEYNEEIILEDLLFHTRILMAKFEAGFDDDCDDFVKNTLKFAKKMKNPSDLHFNIVNFFKQISDKNSTEQMLAFKEFETQLEESEKNRYDKRTLMYIDIHRWIISKVRNVDGIEIIKEKVKAK